MPQGSIFVRFKQDLVRVPWYTKLVGRPSQVLLAVLEKEMQNLRKQGRESTAAMTAASKASAQNLSEFSLPIHSLHTSRNPHLDSAYLLLEERQVGLVTTVTDLRWVQIIGHYKFGLVYLEHNQSTEVEMFNSVYGEPGRKIPEAHGMADKTSPAFKSFLDWMGQKIELKRWKGYRAGLDVGEGRDQRGSSKLTSSADSKTGKYSYWTRWQMYEIMFHVAPLLPHNPNDAQKVSECNAALTPCAAGEETARWKRCSSHYFSKRTRGCKA